MLFPLQDALTKQMITTFPVWAVLFVRSAAVLVVTLAIGRARLVHHVLVTPWKGFLAIRAAVMLCRALVQIAGAGKRPVLYYRDFKLGARRSTLQAQVDLGHPDVPVRIVPCGCDASIRYRRS
jgi:hypothetical protein